MSRLGDDRGMTRRDLMTAGLGAAGLMALGDVARAAPARPFAADEGDYGPFKMGLQSYSLRGLTTDGHADLKKALGATRELGLHHWEAFPAHVPLTDDRAKLQAILDEMEAAGVRLSGYGVVHLGKDEAANRK